MRIRPKRLFLGATFLTAAVLGSLIAATTAQAADTTATFTITAGALTITAPASADLGAVAVGAESIDGQLGSVTVTDTRGVLVGEWAATVVGTDFTTGGGTPGETVPSIDVSYSSGSATSTTGVGTFTPGPGGILNVPRVAFTGTGLTGGNSATWNPTLAITLPFSAPAGTYSGTITQSVA